jgi:glycerol-3-phosphate cytidylyltransferase
MVGPVCLIVAIHDKSATFNSKSCERGSFLLIPPNATQVVLVVGVFDLFHIGHVNMLRAARALGDRLVVVVNGDQLTSSYKRPPIMSEEDRLAVLQSCRYVDQAEISNDYCIRDAVLRHGVTKIVHGDDWEMESYKAQIRCDDAFLEEHGVELVWVPYTPGISTSDIIRACVERGLEDTNGRRGARSCDG